MQRDGSCGKQTTDADDDLAQGVIRMSSEEVTVIIPTYNHSEYLRSSIFSVLNSNVPVRLFVIPVEKDEKTMNLIQHLTDMLKEFDRSVTVIPSDKAEVFYQMQLGIDKLDTEYYTVFGSDDYMLPSMVESMLSLVDGAENPIIGLSFAVTDANLVIQSNQILKPFDMKRMMKGSCIPDIALVRTDRARKVNGFKGDKDWGYLSHYAFYHRLLKQGDATVRLSPEIGFLYRQLKDSRHLQRYKTRADIKKHRKRLREVSAHYWGK